MNPPICQNIFLINRDFWQFRKATYFIVFTTSSSSYSCLIHCPSASNIMQFKCCEMFLNWRMRIIIKPFKVKNSIPLKGQSPRGGTCMKWPTTFSSSWRLTFKFLKVGSWSQKTDFFYFTLNLLRIIRIQGLFTEFKNLDFKPRYWPSKFIKNMVRVYFALLHQCIHFPLFLALKVW